MASLNLLYSPAYARLQDSFSVWLQTLGYAPTTVYNLPRHISEYLRWQEHQGNVTLDSLTASSANAFISHQQLQTGIRTKRNHSAGHLNKYVQALALLGRYLRQTGAGGEGFALRQVAGEKRLPVWLTVEEVRQLYHVTGDTVLGIRDRAMLAVFYGCGLRLNEGTSLEISDILTDRRLLYVRKGKGYKERYVPLTQQNLQHIQDYLSESRPQLLQRSTESLFLGANTGKGLSKQSLYVRVKQLAKTAGIIKDIGTHTLRHSIATHLLQNGVPLEKIQLFLGHESLDSTQLYTHLVNGSL
ncbi:tyrosine-type recombinase/integrase [Chitinophaga sp. GCM10012297]|uniref:Tyrosine-type recombinase/integrase n=1 Tax=Chitinophaga chungangae TaxID=2821488 RepID=A0ABS3YHD1_9BACT|nr:tyrosine-type recombinase/integrase [Chitinophaga chungangae]MBO9154100.1 tyrosine-type recombinase/integrase [Chitinophaga chungangae]